MKANSIFGIHPVRQALLDGSSGRLLMITGKRSKRLDELKRLAEDQSIPLEWTAKQNMDEIAGEQANHQGAVFLADEDPVANHKIEDFLDPLQHQRCFLILDGVTDPGNLGACLRSAATAGVDAVIVPKHGTAPLNSIAMKRSSGAASQIPYIEVVNLARTIRLLKESGVWVLGTRADEEQNIEAIDFCRDIAIVMGSEERGIRHNTAKQCDLWASIPMSNPKFTFNVSVATGICLYEMQRQRHS
ncbi:MAG: 23S rRNA (guanosine(2251)-2'-O)-methyltransferase RlmB [Gammaproteobacteria bacterium]|mgnify:FL=1|nr:23S rRNA (guanosine(2251)-2'-O)-methyltransferase RlmB [Gammaproteobacteria bacterium]MBT5202110.1 23S rRNA (guanosine(2251)-2'-O)-methyltransferase RlmB [Gammaproteobacteria bacterium]MBT5601185.1 23S rRNA (guanosine(2251)-2'-O)-methyltransferase RlmB [Gammaproteobacteria bacterium]MBT6246407.1 23S rRNA (guanosine(2251)-2'-O)-methyltransferase RlmB [Gammaproteobacteria bacterium]